MMRKTIVIVQDSDCDGIMSATLFYLFLRHYKYPEDKIIVLHQFGKEHGVNDYIYSQMPSNSIVIIPDASCTEKYRKQLKVKKCNIYTIDHHDTITEEWTINNQHSPLIRNKAGSGTLVAFNFIRYFCEKHKDNWYKTLVDLVMVGNMADVMSTKCYPYENRVFNQLGMKNIKNPFLKYLFDNLLQENYTITDIVWNVSPLINACCRSNNQDLKSRLFNCFVGNDTDFEGCLSEMRKQKSKQDYQTKKMMDDIEILYDNKAIIAKCSKTAYTGLTANKLLSEYKRPILLVSENKGVLSGSVRSLFPTKDIFNESGLFIENVGHSQAHGTSFKVEKLNDIKSFFDDIDISSEIEHEVTASFKASDIPKHLFKEFSENPNLFVTDVPKPQFHIQSMSINTNDIEFLGRYGTTMKFKKHGITYIRQYTSKVFKAEHNLLKPNVRLNIELIGTFELDDYGNPTVKIDKDGIEISQKADLDLIDELF